MVDRVRTRDLAFLTAETPQTPAHNATIEIFDPGDSGFDYDAAGRPDRATGSRSCRATGSASRWCPAASPPRSGSTTRTSTSRFHVRRSALPRPGYDRASCCELASRIVSRPLDRTRPLWEVYFVEGLEGGRVALLSKTHQALVDGVADRRPRPAPARHPTDAARARARRLGAAARAGPRRARGRRGPRRRHRRPDRASTPCAGPPEPCPRTADARARRVRSVAGAVDRPPPRVPWR